ncbi:MAG: hypothetical protein JW719_09130 [Pirellulales bacterium]|nr:hypothetical protein [Pirellulales bacterium]
MKTCFVLACFAWLFAPIAAGREPGSELPKFKRLGIVLDFNDLKYNPANDVIFPCVIDAKRHFSEPLGRFYMYYAPHNAPGGVCLAYADNLEGPWREYENNPIISRDWQPHYRVSHVSSPHALWIDEENKLFLWFHGNNHVTRYASSTDGIHFNYEGVAVSKKDFNDISECSYARVFKHEMPHRDARYVILLMGNNRGHRRIYLGWSKDARHWTTRRDPFISAPPESTSGQTVSPWLLPWNGKLYVIHHSQFRFEPGGVLRSILATEVDPGFTKTSRPVHVFTALPDPPENGRVASPCFIQEGSKLYMFYQSGKRLRSKIALAVADVPSPTSLESSPTTD